MEHPERPEASREQLFYAAVLEKGMLIVSFILFVTFGIYVLGILAPSLSPYQVQRYWGLSVGEYLQRVNGEPGWGWLRQIQHGDFLSLAGIAALLALVIPCYLMLIPMFLRERDWVYVGFVIVQVVILLLVASGLLVRFH